MADPHFLLCIYLPFLVGFSLFNVSNPGLEGRFNKAPGIPGAIVTCQRNPTSSRDWLALVFLPRSVADWEQPLGERFSANTDEFLHRT